MQAKTIHRTAWGVDITNYPTYQYYTLAIWVNWFKLFPKDKIAFYSQF